MKKKVGMAVGIWLAGAVFIGSGGLNRLVFRQHQDGVYTVQAGKEASSSELQKEIDAVNEEKQAVEEEKEQLENDIAEIETKKDDVSDYIEALDKKLQNLSDKLEQNEKELTAVKKEIKALQKDKKQAEEQKESQYDTMVKRIKYMYENGKDGYLDLLLGADSLSELFNRAEYVNKVTSYDNNMFLEYQEACEQLEQAEEKWNESRQKLENLKESLETKKESVDLLMERKKQKMKQYQTLIDDKSSEVEAKDNLLEEQDDELEALLEAQRKKAEQEAKEQAAKEQEAKKQETNEQETNEQETAEKNASDDSNQTATGYRWPLAVSGRITSYFGYRSAPTAGASTYHKGIDIAVPTGTNILAAKEGTVVTATYSASAGNFIAVYHGDGVYSYYMHCSRLLVSVGTKVSQGQRIALSGSTGISTGPHLHFAMYANGAYVNPLIYVSQ